MSQKTAYCWKCGAELREMDDSVLCGPCDRGITELLPKAFSEAVAWNLAHREAIERQHEADWLRDLPCPSQEKH